MAATLLALGRRGCLLGEGLRFPPSTGALAGCDFKSPFLHVFFVSSADLAAAAAPPPPLLNRSSRQRYEGNGQ
jgi:hypothetical protein